MFFWGLSIDTVTSVMLILAIGLCVDYAAHIGHAFMTSSHETRNGTYPLTESPLLMHLSRGLNFQVTVALCSVQ